MFAIRQKSTGWFMPTRRTNRGFTWDEPKADCMPRVFRRRQDAAAALKWWLNGAWSERSYQTFEGEWDVDLGAVSKPHRNADDMEVIEVTAVHVAMTGREAAMQVIDELEDELTGSYHGYQPDPAAMLDMVSAITALRAIYTIPGTSPPIPAAVMLT